MRTDKELQEIMYRGEVTSNIPLDRIEAICNAYKMIGTAVYAIGMKGVQEATVEDIRITEKYIVFTVDRYLQGYDCIVFYEYEIGKTLFLDRESAENALKGVTQ